MQRINYLNKEELIVLLNIMIGEFGLLVDLGLIVVFATLFNFLFRLIKQPPLLAYIVAGMVLGPIGLGAMNINLFGIPLGITSMADIRLLSELGVAFLLFSVGMETNFSKLGKFWKVVAIGGLIQIGLTVLFVYLTSFVFSFLTPYESIFFGLCLAFSSTMVVVKLLSDHFELDTLHARLMIGFLILQDIVVVLIVPMFSSFQDIFSGAFLSQFALSGAAIVILAFVLSKFIYPRIYKFSARSNELLFLTSLTSCFVFIFLSQYVLHLPIALGAFMAGFSLAALPYTTEIYNQIRGVRDFFVTIFFVTIGMQLSFMSILSEQYLFMFLLALAVVFIVKPIIFFFITLFGGYGVSIALTVALGLAQVSEFSFILANEALANNLISQEIFSVILLAVAFSMVLTPYFFRYNALLAKYLSAFSMKLPTTLHRDGFHRHITPLEESKKLEGHLVIVGAGTMGHSLIKELDNHPLTIVDQNPDVIHNLMEEDYNAIYGFADNAELWHKLNLGKAKGLILTIPNAESSEELLKYAKELNPKLPVFARAHYYNEALRFYEYGCDYVIMPYVVASSVLLKNITSYFDTGKLSDGEISKKEFLKFIKDQSKDEVVKSHSFRKRII